MKSAVIGVIVIYVDDILICSTNPVIAAVAKSIKELWSTSPLAMASDGAIKFLGLEIEKIDGGFAISQADYIAELLRNPQSQGNPTGFNTGVKGNLFVCCDRGGGCVFGSGVEGSPAVCWGNPLAVAEVEAGPRVRSEPDILFDNNKSSEKSVVYYQEVFGFSPAYGRSSITPGIPKSGTGFMDRRVLRARRRAKPYPDPPIVL